MGYIRLADRFNFLCNLPGNRCVLIHDTLPSTIRHPDPRLLNFPLANELQNQPNLTLHNWLLPTFFSDFKSLNPLSIFIKSYPAVAAGRAHGRFSCRFDNVFRSPLSAFKEAIYPKMCRITDYLKI